jgi:hypothetical protein
MMCLYLPFIPWERWGRYAKLAELHQGPAADTPST